MVSRNRKVGIEGVEPSEMSVPKMDRVSVTFALMLDSFVMEWDGPTDATLMTCEHCSEQICAVEAGDTMRVLLNTALAHTC